ncbi:sugar phosphate isomerase/epimerase family protein [Paenibacillus mesophilus]|uniref:sugar phosphate isomerase/epimerase family protein n=1 Tax=Paenibacillus mesophilus TaxID=2582849 RepID=UPI001305071B|nr:TIM barrel protein [Paenibacillus mesophilus]
MIQHRVNDCSNASPRLDIQQAWWTMVGLGDGQREWTFEEKFEKIAEAGFTGIVGFVPEPAEAERWRRKLDEYRFGFGALAFPRKREDLRKVLHQAKHFGAQYINAQVMDSFVIGDEAIALLNGLIDEAAAAQMPFFAETHRGRVTQDLHRTVEYVNAIPDLRLTIDLSHYVVAGELADGSAQAEPFFDDLLRRTSAIHARVSNGQQIQVDIGPNGEHPMVPHFMRWWENGVRYWLQEALPGDVLPVLPELGPPSYGITSDNYAANRLELSDRWQQALLFKRLILDVWQRAQR